MKYRLGDKVTISGYLVRKDDVWYLVKPDVLIEGIIKDTTKLSICKDEPIYVVDVNSSADYIVPEVFILKGIPAEMLRDRKKKKIKFRGVSVDTGLFVYGDLFTDNDSYSISYIDQRGKRVPVLVYPNTVGEYIGISDVHGKDLYEGDFVEIKYNIYYGNADYQQVSVTGVIEYDTVGFDVFDNKGKGLGLNKHFYESITYLGTIYDDPRLVKSIKGNIYER